MTHLLDANALIALGWRAVWRSTKTVRPLFGAGLGQQIRWVNDAPAPLSTGLYLESGVLFAAKVGFISPENFPLNLSVMFIAIVVLGGSGNIPGVVLGAMVISYLPERLRGFSEYRVLMFGAALVLMMNIRPEGLLPRRVRGKVAKDG